MNKWTEKRNLRIGEERINNVGSLMKVIQYNNCYDILVRFIEHDCTVRTRWGEFCRGEVKSPYDKSVHNIGYLGEGDYIIWKDGKTTPQYAAWKRILARCYDGKTLERQTTYKGVSVCDEWHNFQNFAKWYDENYYEIEGERMCLDKDILVKGNKVYSPDTCVFVPSCINNMFVKNNARRGKLPIGVHQETKAKHNFIARCNDGNGNYTHIGMFDTPSEAFSAYKDFKEKAIKDVANKYYNKIPQKLYNSMIKYIVEIDD